MERAADVDEWALRKLFGADVERDPNHLYREHDVVRNPLKLDLSDVPFRSNKGQAPGEHRMEARTREGQARHRLHRPDGFRRDV